MTILHEIRKERPYCRVMSGDCVKCKIYVTEKYTFVTNGKENYKQTGIGFEVVLGKFWLAIVNPRKAPFRD